jgi:hypothetical protein
MKPARLDINVKAIPLELVEQTNWIVWRWEKREGKWTKPLYQVNGENAKSNDPATWTEFKVAYEALSSDERWDGIGYVITKESGYTGIDWDDCLEDGKIDPEIHKWVEAINSYTEISPSGRGLKTIVRGSLPKTGHHSDRIGVFDSARYFCVTGRILNGFSKNIERRQDELNELVRKFWPNDFKTTITVPVQLSEQDIIEKAISANDGGKFKKLWEGDTSDYKSPSEADLALCCKIAFWVNNDRGRVDAIFRQSALMRKKWEREDYRNKTIDRAIEISSDTYKGGEQTITLYNNNITEHNITPKKTSIGPTEAVLDFLSNCSNREFSFRDCYQHIKGLCTDHVSEPSLRAILHRMVKQRRRIAAHNRAGHYRIVSCDYKIMDLANAKSVRTDIELPLDLNAVVDLKAGQIVLVAGVTNTGKTSFMLDLMARNMKRWKVRYINSEMDAAEFRDVLDQYKGVTKFDEWKFEPIRLDRNMHPADLILPGYGNLNIIDYLEAPEAKFAADWVAEIHDRLDGAVACISVQRHPGRDYGHGGAMLNARPRLVLNLDWRKCTIAKVKFWKRKETGWNPNGMYFEWEMDEGWRPRKTSKLMNTQQKYENQ